MHCQHHKKPLTTAQLQQAANAVGKKQKKALMSSLRNKKTQCPSTLTLTLQVPTKKQQRASECHPYLLSHKAVLKIDFTHNHPLTAAHALSFRPVSADTKKQFFDLFSKGHSASSARHTHEQMLLLNSETDAEKQIALADRAVNPNVQDICRLFMEWRRNNHGEENGRGMFERLQKEVDKYNDIYVEG